MAKQILFNEEARRSLERGVNALADAVMRRMQAEVNRREAVWQ